MSFDSFNTLILWLVGIIPIAGRLLGLSLLGIGYFRERQSLQGWRWFFWGGLIYTVYFAYIGIVLSATNPIPGENADWIVLLNVTLAAAIASAVAVVIARISRTQSCNLKPFRFSLKEGLAFVSLFSLQLALHAIVRRSVAAYLENAEITGDYWPFVL